MYKLTMIAGLLMPGRRKSEMAAYAVAGLLLLVALTATAQAQGEDVSPGRETTEPAKGPTVRVHYSTNYCNAFWNGTQMTNTDTGLTVVQGGTLGLVPGQSFSVTAPNSYLQDGSVRFFVKHTIKIYETTVSHGVTERESGLIYSGESGGGNEALHEVGHIFTIARSQLPAAGDPLTARIQIWFEIESFLSPTQVGGEVLNLEMLEPTFETIDERGATNAFGRSVAISIRARPELAPTQTELNKF